MRRDDIYDIPAKPAVETPSANKAKPKVRKEKADPKAKPTVEAKSETLSPLGFYLSLLFACAIPLSNNISDPDLWGHVQYGLDVLRDGLQYTATYTYSAAGARWISHENLAELLFAIGMTTLGPTAVLMLKSALGVAVITWMLQRARREGVGITTAFVLFPLVSMNLMHFWNLRPQTFSFLIFTLIVVLLEWCFTGWTGKWHLPVLRTLFARDPSSTLPDQQCQSDLKSDRLRYLWLLPPLMAIWTNTHGAFIAGCCILTAYLGCRSLELWCDRGRAAWPTIRYLGLILTATLLSTLANPLGWDLHLELFQRLSVPRPEIIEWQPPEFWSIVWVQFWVLLALAGAAVLVARRPRDFTHLVIFALVAWQAMEHRRHIAFVAILFGFWFPPLVESLFRRLQNIADNAADDFTVTPAFKLPILGGLALFCLAAAGLLYDQLQVLPVRKDRYPVEAFQFMRDHRLDRQGKFVCQFEWAQYAIMAFGQRKPGEPGLLLQFDGRFRELYPQEVLDMYWDFDFGHTAPLGRYRSPQSPPITPERVLSHLLPDLVLMSRERPQAIAVLEEHSADWVLLYQDGLASLWGRREKYDNPTSVDYLPPERRAITNTPQAGITSWPALPTKRNADVQSAAFKHHEKPSDERNDS